MNGYGIDGVREKVQLLTGIAVHEILAMILTMLKNFPPGNVGVFISALDKNQVARQQIRNFINQKLKEYQETIEQNGFYGVEDPLAQKLMLIEQLHTIEGLIWGWVKVMLPILLRDFEIVAVEQEEGVVLGCTCGLGSKVDWLEHKTKGCHGILQQSRPDILLLHRATGTLGIHDFKTTKAYDARSVERYRNSVQMAVGTVGVERRLGKPVTNFYVHFLVKGTVRASYVKSMGDYSGPLQLQNDFCYVTYQPPQPPLSKEKITTTGTWYTKTPVWQIEFQGKPGGVSNVEWLVEKLPLAELMKLFILQGPYDRQTFLINGYLRQVEADEKRWSAKLWAVYEGQAAGRPIEECLDENIPASWDCYAYNETCVYLPICTRDMVFAADPMASGKYRLRVPHHEPEKLQLFEDARDEGIPLPVELVHEYGAWLMNQAKAKLSGELNA